MARRSTQLEQHGLAGRGKGGEGGGVLARLYKPAKEPEAKETENSSEQVATTTTTGQNSVFHIENYV